MYCRVSKNSWRKLTDTKTGYRKDSCIPNRVASTSVGAKCKGKGAKYVSNFRQKYAGRILFSFFLNLILRTGPTRRQHQHTDCTYRLYIQTVHTDTTQTNFVITTK